MHGRVVIPAVGVLLTCLTGAASAAAALPVESGSNTSPLSTTLRYRTITWRSQGADMSVMAPRGWSMVLTPEGQARFAAPQRPDVLTMGYRGEGRLRPQLLSKVAALRGTPGLHVLVAHAQGRGDSASGELRYTWSPPAGETRVVAYRYVGNDAYMVAGPIGDQEGLEAVLRTAAATGECS